ncbi:hypothetical protein M3Y99_00328900 [Aphelenchoides fujianensis]|nr:hypothetical protein M3Y99_00328900 [Aphelenchoides fujianensis]
MTTETANGSALDHELPSKEDPHSELAVDDEHARDEADDFLEERLKEAAIIEPPDGGYGWIVLGCAFFCNVIVDGIIFTAPERLLPMWETSFGGKSPLPAFTCSLLTGSYLLVRLQACWRTLTGAIESPCSAPFLAACGFLLSAIVQEQLLLCFTFGIVGGAGLGLVFLAAVVSVSEYFNQKRALATGIAVCGSGIGTAGLSTLNPWIIERLGGDWRLYCVFICCFAAIALFFGWFFKPLQPSSTQLNEVAEITADYIGRNGEPGSQFGEESGLSRAEYTSSPHIPPGVAIERFPQSNGGGLSGSRHLGAGRPFLSTIELHASRQGDKAHMSQQDLAKFASKASLAELNRPLSKIDIFYPGSTKTLAATAAPTAKADGRSRTKSGRDLYLSTIGLPTADDYVDSGSHAWYHGIVKQLKSLLDISLLRSPSFLILALGGFLTLICFFVPFIWPKAKGVDEVRSKYLVTAMGLINIVARVLCGWISDHPRVDPLVVSNVAVISGGVATMVLPYFDSFTAFAIYCIPFASGVASFAALRSVICANLLGMERLTNAYGFLMLFMGIAALIGPPFASFLKNISNGFGLAFTVMGGFMTLSGIISLPLRRINNWERKRDEVPPTSAVELQPLAEKSA